MPSKKPFYWAAAALAAAVLACSFSPTSIIENAAEEALNEVQATVEAQTGLNIEELQATAEAAAGDVNLEELQATVEAAAGDVDLEELQATVEAAAGDLDVESLQATAEAAAGGVEFGENVDTEFPIPEGSTNIVVVGEVLNLTSSLTLEDAVAFYRAEFAAAGYTERELLTTIEEDVASLVFDGHESGKAIVVQMVDLGVAGLNINVRLEDQ